MRPERAIEVKGHKVAEYYWAGKMVVYVDNRAVSDTYYQAIERLEAGAEPHFLKTL